VFNIGLFDSFKKKKQPLPELETPPVPEGTPEAVQNRAMSSPQEIPSFSMEAPQEFQQEGPLNTLQDVPMPPEDMRVSPPQQMPIQQMQQTEQRPFEMQEPMQQQIPQQMQQQIPQQMSQFQPAQQFQMPLQRQQQDFPKPEEVFNQQLSPMQPFPSSQYSQPSLPPQPLFQQEPRFTFYAQPREEHHEEHNEEQNEFHQEEPRELQEVPFDVTQELLSLPKIVQKKEFHSVHIPKRFLTVAMLLDIGTQLINIQEDLTLGKDTVFRLGDLNEQEIEMMARWNALHQSMELRMAEIDKILFKA
jgi:hypothetical protein